MLGAAAGAVVHSQSENIAFVPFACGYLADALVTEDDRMRIADDTLRELRRYGERQELDDTVNGGPTVANSAGSSKSEN